MKHVFARNDKNISNQNRLWYELFKKITLVEVAVALLSFVGCHGSATDSGTKAFMPKQSIEISQPDEQEAIGFEKQLGIEIISLRLTAANRMLDFRYKVIDSQKVHQLMNRGSKAKMPYLIDQTSGAKLTVPTSTKLGPLRQTTLQPEAGRIYFALFSNSGNLVKRGNKVDVVIGDLVAKDLVVQ